MALLESNSTLLDLDLLQNPSTISLSDLSPVSSSLSSHNSVVTWNASSSSDDDSSVTSLVNASAAAMFQIPQQQTFQDPQFLDFDLEDFASGFEEGVSSAACSEMEVSPSSSSSLSSSSSSSSPPSNHREGPSRRSWAYSEKNTQGKKTKASKQKVPKPTSANNNLPPCRICADAASGFHYGVNSCEACKRFFRRALKRKRNFKCRGTKNCAIKGQKNNLCGHCRYTRCLALGMSKTAIKTGRYTHEKRAQDIREVQRRVTDDGALSMADGEVCHVVHTLMSVHAKVITNADVPDDVMQETGRRKVEEFQLKKEMFGFQDTLTPQQYDEVFRVTGLDVDERQQDMKIVAKAIDIFVDGYVRFGKGVPGFSDLPLADQANLLKLARVEVWFLGAYRGFLGEVFYAPNRQCRHRFEMERLLGREYTDCAMELAASLRKMRLTREEEVVLKAVCLTFTDRCPLEEPGRVEAIQWRMMKCFLHLLRQNHPQDPGMFHRVVSWAVAVRNLTELSRKALTNTHFADAIRTNATLVDMILV